MKQVTKFIEIGWSNVKRVLSSRSTIEDDLVEAVPASLSTGNAATFHGMVLELEVFEIGLANGAGPSLISCANRGSLAGLAGYITATMLLGNTTACDAACGERLSSYIIGVFNGQAQQVSDDTVGFINRLSAVDTVRKAGLKRVSRLPTLNRDLQRLPCQG